jgi:hypothetical protein
MTFACSICEEQSTTICACCTKDACDNHICKRCGCCSDCCECDLPLDAFAEEHAVHVEPAAEHEPFAPPADPEPADQPFSTTPGDSAPEPFETSEF